MVTLPVFPGSKNKTRISTFTIHSLDSSIFSHFIYDITVNNFV